MPVQDPWGDVSRIGTIRAGSSNALPSTHEYTRCLSAEFKAKSRKQGAFEVVLRGVAAFFEQAFQVSLTC